MNERLLSMKGLVIEQSKIDNNLESIWSHLVDDKWLDSYADLKSLNIQVNSTSIDEEAAKALHESIQ
jgi:acyl carrier protein phosphodiesterase